MTMLGFLLSSPSSHCSCQFDFNFLHLNQLVSALSSWCSVFREFDLYCYALLVSYVWSLFLGDGVVEFSVIIITNFCPWR